MQTLYKRFSVIAGFALLIVILIGNAFITRSQLGVQIGTESWVAHSRQVLLELSQTESLLKDAETGQRGFLYTGNPKYLTPYNAAISQVLPHIDNLAQLTADNPRQQAQIPALRRLANAKLAELAHTIALYQSGKPDEAKAVVLSDAGLLYMQGIRAIAAQMQSEELSLEASRTAEYKKSIRRTIACIYLASLLAIVGLAFLAYYILHEIHLREKHAQELRAKEEWFRVTLTSIGDAVIATDAQGNVTFMNPLAITLTGIDANSAIGKHILEVFPIFNEHTNKPAENPVGKVMSLGRVVGLANHTVLQNRNGTLTPIEDSAAPIRDDRGTLIGVVLVFRDVTHERKSQDVLRKTEKLAAAARLSATVAHEINNPLEAIFNLVYVAKAHPDTPSSVVQQLTLAEQELERVAHITRQTLGFYRDSSVSERIEIPALIESVFTLYSHKFHAKNIRIERHFSECPPLRGVPGELKQAISNLISNAADAVAWQGTITVRLQCIEENGARTVKLAVEDDGTGIEPEYMDRIFEPFFTTKQDVGTGLGLWVPKGIIERHGGRILARSRNDNGRGRGAVFTILLPLDFESQNDASLGSSNASEVSSN
jgi:PAS domain S-box-containing protein